MASQSHDPSGMIDIRWLNHDYGQHIFFVALLLEMSSVGEVTSLSMFNK